MRSPIHHPEESHGSRWGKRVRRHRRVRQPSRPHSRHQVRGLLEPATAPPQHHIRALDRTTPNVRPGRYQLKLRSVEVGLRAVGKRGDGQRNAGVHLQHPVRDQQVGKDHRVVVRREEEVPRVPQIVGNPLGRPGNHPIGDDREANATIRIGGRTTIEGQIVYSFRNPGEEEIR